MSRLARMYRNETDVKFPEYWKKVLAVSMAILVIGAISLLTRGLNLGLEFEGGAAWEVPSNGVSTDALVAINGTSARLEDLGSTNGTYVGEKPIDTCELTDKSEFRIGAHELVFVMRDHEN